MQRQGMPAGGGIGVRILLVRCGTRILGRQFAAAEKGGAGSPAGAPRGFCCLWLLLSLAAVVCCCCICRSCCGSETLAGSTLGGQHKKEQARAKAALANNLLDQGEFEEALALYQEVLELLTEVRFQYATSMCACACIAVATCFPLFATRC